MEELKKGGLSTTVRQKATESRKVIKEQTEDNELWKGGHGISEGLKTDNDSVSESRAMAEGQKAA
jgi:hypothetical protein